MAMSSVGPVTGSGGRPDDPVDASMDTRPTDGVPMESVMESIPTGNSSCGGHVRGVGVHKQVNRYGFGQIDIL